MGKIKEEGDTLHISTEEEKPRASLKQKLTAIKDALSFGAISERDAREYKARLGISQSYFTRKQTTKAQRVKKRKAQRRARRANRGRKKGMSIRKGQKFKVNHSAAK